MSKQNNYYQPLRDLEDSYFPDKISHKIEVENEISNSDHVSDIYILEMSSFHWNYDEKSISELIELCGL